MSCPELNNLFIEFLNRNRQKQKNMIDIDMTYRHSDQNAPQFHKEDDDIWRNAEEEKQHQGVVD